MAATIVVHAYLPEETKDRETDLPLYLAASNWHWIEAFKFPVEELKTITLWTRLYQWVRFATGVVLGAHGHLSTDADDPDAIVDYTTEPTERSFIKHLYYHYESDDRTRLFVLNHHTNNSRTSIGHSETSRDADFRSIVVERDGENCVLTDLREQFCEAIHLIPHAKQSEYFQLYQRNRMAFRQNPSNVIDDTNVISDIDNIQNGILLSRDLHPFVGTQIGFLVVPNFAMERNDIPAGDHYHQMFRPGTSPSPGSHPPDYAPAPESASACVAHYFSSREHFGGVKWVAYSGAPVRQAKNDWPPAILFDHTYAQAVYRNYASDEFKDHTRKLWHGLYYPGGVQTAQTHQLGRIAQEKRAKNDKTAFDNEERDKRAEKRSKRPEKCDPDGFEPLILFHDLLAAPTSIQELDRLKAHAEVDTKVNAWLKAVVDI